MRKRHLFILLSIVLCVTIVFWIIQIVNGYVPLVDQWTRDLVFNYQDTFIYSFAVLVTNLGSRHFLVPFAIFAAIVLGFLYKHWLPPILFIGGTLITYNLNGMIKNIINRERPMIAVEVNAVGHSFPSGHAMISMVCYGLLGYFIARSIKSKSLSFVIQIIFSFTIFIIGISRYILNVHYITDIVAGFVIGFILLIGFIYLYERFPYKT